MDLTLKKHLYISGDVWRPVSDEDHWCLNHLIGKGHVEDKPHFLSALEYLAQIHGIKVNYV